VYLERHVANLRLGMRLELFTAIGALVGGTVAFLVSEQDLAGLFTVLLVYTALTMARSREPTVPGDPTVTDVPVASAAHAVTPRSASSGSSP